MDKGTNRQRDKGTKGQRDKETKRKMDKGKNKQRELRNLGTCNLLGQQKIMQPLGTKKTRNLSG